MHGSTPLNRPFPLPYDIVEMVIAHLTHDLSDLKACSLTCRSWYTATVQHLHYTITLVRNKPDIGNNRLEPLSTLHELGLLSLVKAIRLLEWPATGYWFVSPAFNRATLRPFSALTNVHTLKLQYMEVYRCMPDVEPHFGHFSQTLRSITLYQPRGTSRQLSHFLSYFSNLDDIGIRNPLTRVSNTIVPDPELIPRSAPKLRGRLALYSSTSVEICTDLITSCGGLRFRHMDLCWSESCAPVLLEACAETLETLRLGGMMYDSGSEWFRTG